MSRISALLILAAVASAADITFSGIPNNSTMAACQENTATLSAELSSLQPGDTFIIPNTTFYVIGGVQAYNLDSVVIQLDGTLKWTEKTDKWPYKPTGRVEECWYMANLHNVTFTSSGAGTLYGNGQSWWGFLSYLEIAENRPRLFHIYNSTNLLLEHWYFEQSPYWTTLWQDVADLTIRYCHINNRRNEADRHSLWNLGAFNTDGFDVSGRNVHIHDCHIWNQDDCIVVQQLENGINSKCSENMLFERIYASGLGLSIGSIGPTPEHTCVKDITFRNCTMERTFKGLYAKTHPGNGTAEISNILYEDIIINEPSQWAIWIGPGQEVEYPGQCSLLWPIVPFTKCPTIPNLTWNNITYRDILITNPTQSPGVILGNDENPMTNIVFDNVRAEHAWSYPWFGDYYKCEGVKSGIATGGTYPVPPCFEDNN